MDKHTAPQPPKRKRDITSWPNRILALLVMGSCLFVGISSFHLLTDNLSLWHPLDPSTYGAARNSIDAAYTKQMFASRAPAPTATDNDKPYDTHPVENPIKGVLVDINGLAGDVLGQREMNSIIKLDNGYITAYLDEMQDLSYQLSKTIEFSNFAQERGSRFVFVMAPHLIDKFQPLLPAGVNDYYNQLADLFLEGLENAGVPYIDLRQTMQDENFDHYGGFFRTDHHWRPETSSWAANQVMQTMDSWGWLNTQGITLSPDDFTFVHQPVSFYGTAAERTGPAFAGKPDTLECLVPKPGLVEMQVKRYDEPPEAYMPIEFEPLYRDWQYAVYDETLGPDAYYLYKSMFERTILNKKAPVDNHLMLVSDSFGVPFQSFAACYTREFSAFEGRAHGDLSLPVEQSDIVMVLFNPSSLDIRTENQTIFNFI